MFRVDLVVEAQHRVPDPHALHVAFREVGPGRDLHGDPLIELDPFQVEEEVTPLINGARRTALFVATETASAPRARLMPISFVRIATP